MLTLKSARCISSWVAVGSDSTLFPSSKYKISYVTKTDDNDALGGGVWYPSDFWVPDSFTGSDAKMNAGKSTFNKHTTVTLELSNAAMDWDGTDLHRLVPVTLSSMHRPLR